MTQVHSSSAEEESPAIGEELGKHAMSTALDSIFPGLGTVFDATDAAIEMQDQHSAVAPRPMVVLPVQAPIAHEVAAKKRKLFRT